jgi:hypothetical protein
MPHGITHFSTFLDQYLEKERENYKTKEKFRDLGVSRSTRVFWGCGLESFGLRQSLTAGFCENFNECVGTESRVLLQM